MDIKALYKVSDVAKYVAEKEKEDKENQNNPEDPGDGNEDVSEQIKDLYDRTTIQYEDEDKGLEEITLKDDYLNTKESLEDSIKNLGDNYTALNNTLTNHINNSSIHSGGSGSNPGTQTGNTLNVKTLNILNNNNAIAGTLSSNYTTQYLDINAGNRIQMKVGGTEYLRFHVDGGTSVQLEASKFDVNGKEINVGTGLIKGKGALKENHFKIQYAKFLDCDVSGLGISLEAQSEYTTSLINSGTDENKTHINMSYDSNEVRWCWKENVFTYKEAEIDPETDEWVYTGRHICYIELPIFLAENIENNYHINVCKMSWGDYRIIEKNPYYFILESQEEDFAFTFEVVAKLIDNQTLDNNATIANMGYED